jgi:hypothetical protein
MGWWKESPDELAKQGLETCDESKHPEPKDCYWCDFDTRTWKRGWCPGGGSAGGANRGEAGTLGGLLQLGQDFGGEGISNIFASTPIDYRSPYVPVLPGSDAQRAAAFRSDWDTYSFGVDPRRRVRQ